MNTKMDFYVNEYIRKWIHTYIHLYIHVCIETDLHERTLTYIHTYNLTNISSIYSQTEVPINFQ